MTTRVIDADVLVDGRLAQQLRDTGLSWTAIGDELGCPAHLARRIAQHYLDDAHVRAHQHQIALF